MEEEALHVSPETSMEQEGKESEDNVSSRRAGAGEKMVETSEQAVNQPVETTQTWRDKLPEVVRQGADLVKSKVQPLMEHPYVAQGTETVQQGIRQTSAVIAQGAAAAPARLQPIVNHPYVQKSTGVLSSSVAQVKPLVGSTADIVSSSLQPVVGKAAETVQLGKETAKKIYYKEEGYEPAKIVPYLAGSLGVLILCILLAGWSSGGGSSKYNVDVSNIVADKIKLPNGRHLAYVEHGASKADAKHNILFVHGLMSSRLLGPSGINENLLKKFSVRLVSYDRPGIGQSDPQPKRTLNSSAEDMADIADILGMGNKFWIFAHSGGAAYAWAALHYIPDRLAGVAMFGPLMNPYAKNATKEETKAMWAGLNGLSSTFWYARHFPSFVPRKLRGNVKKVNKYMKKIKQSVNPKDRALMETDAFGEAWECATLESVRSKDPKPHAQDMILQAQDWGFQLSDIRPKLAKKSLLSRIFSFFRGSEMPGFSGPIHIFHGTEDKLVPVIMSEYAKRILPQVELHKLEGEGHYSWFFNCDHCHRELLKTLFGEVAGLEELDAPVASEERNNIKPESVEHEQNHEENHEEKHEKTLEPHLRIEKPEVVIRQGPEKPEEGALNDLTIAEKEAEKIALFKEAGLDPPIEPQIGLSPEQYDELQHEIEVKHSHEHEAKHHEEL